MKVPTLNLAKGLGGYGGEASAITTREEQDQYKLHGMQDGKV